MCYVVAHALRDKDVAVDERKLLCDYQEIDSFTSDDPFVLFSPQRAVYFDENMLAEAEGICTSSSNLEEGDRAPTNQLFLVDLFEGVPRADSGREPDYRHWAYARDEMTANAITLDYQDHVLEIDPGSVPTYVEVRPHEVAVVFWNPSIYGSGSCERS